MTKPDEIAAVIDRIVADHGQLDILVNNAGINTLAHRVTIDEFPRDEWDRILAVDLTGLYEVSRAAARVMRARGLGPDHQHRVDRRPRPLAAPVCLRRGQGGRRQLDPRDGPRARPARDSGQRLSRPVPR